MSTTNPSGFDYKLTRVLDAPVGNVWAAWTQADHYANWFHASAVQLDVRPGGRWQATMSAPDGGQYPLTGCYREVVENRRLVSTMDIPGQEATVMVMELTDLDGKTEIVLSQTCATEQERDESKEGSEMLLEWCSAYVTTI